MSFQAKGRGSLSRTSQQNESPKYVDVEELRKAMSQRIHSTDFMKLLDSAFQHLPDTEATYFKRRKLVETVLKTLRSATLSINRVDEIIHRLSVDFPRYPRRELIKLVDFSVDSLCANDDPYKSWTDTIPILLQALEDEKSILYGNREISGTEYKSTIVNNICNSHWDPEIPTSLAKMFGDMYLEKNERDTVICALCRKISTMDLNELPPFVHQMLRLCGNYDCKQLLENLRKYFSEQYAAAASQNEDSLDEIAVVSLKEVQDTEGTVLYHIYQAAQLNYKSIRDFIRALKNLVAAPEYILEPFMLSVLLLFSNVYDEQVFDVLKQAISRSLQDEEKSKNSAWLLKYLPKKQNMLTVFENIIANSKANRHMVLKGLVELSFALLSVDSNHSKLKNDANGFWKIGSTVLQTAMKKRHEIGATVLQTLVDKIIAGGLNIRQYTECLAYMCRKLTIIVLECHALIITLLDQLSNIPGESAELVFYAILPLIRISGNVRDNLILALRKVLHRKGTSRRQMAVTGFLEILKNFNTRSAPTLSQTSLSLSQPSSSGNVSILTQVTLETHTQEMRGLSSTTKSLCLDILNILKKCFTHEYEVKSRFYNGLYDVVLKNPEIAEYILEMLYSHFKGYYDSDINAQPALQFDLCSVVTGSTTVPHEPLAELISLICQIYVKIADKTSPIVENVAEMLESLCQRMSQMEMEHLNIDDSINLHESTVKSQQKLESVKLCIMIYEVLISLRIDSWSVQDPNSAQNVYKLYKPYKRFIDFTKRHSKTKKADGKHKKKKDKMTHNNSIKKSNRSNNVNIDTIMDLNTACKALEILYLESTPWSSKEQTEYIRSHADFHNYILQTCTQLSQNAKNISGNNLEQYKKRYLLSWINIGQLLYKHAICELIDTHHNDPQRAAYIVECFNGVCAVMCTTFATQFSKFLHTIFHDVDDSDSEELYLHALINSVKTLLHAFLEVASDDETDSTKKILRLFFETIQQLVHKIDFQETNVEKVQKWLLTFTELSEIDTSLTVIILQLILWVDERYSQRGEMLGEICMELHKVFPTIDEEEVTVQESFKIITEETSTHVYNLVNNCIREKLSNAVWLLARIKAEQVGSCIPGSDNETCREEVKNKERTLCKLLSYILHLLCGLANMKIDPGPCTENIFKNLQCLYNLLSSLTKYFCSKSTAQYPAFQAAKFIQVIQLAGKPLKTVFYNLIVHTEERQTKNSAKSKADRYAQRNKVLKETRIIPRVVYEIEQFKKEIMILEKKTGVPLETYISHSTTRDFRIKSSQLEEGLAGMNSTLSSTLSSPDLHQNAEQSMENATPNSSIVESDDSCPPPSKKRQKMSS